MRRLPFSIRDLLIATLVVALALVLVHERTRNSAARKQLDDLLKSPHVWISYPPSMTDRTRIPTGSSVGFTGEFFYSDKEGYAQPITATVTMIDAASQKAVAEVADVATVGVPGRRSFSANFNNKLYGKQLQPGIYIFLAVLSDGEKEIGRGSTSLEFYKRQN